MIDIHTHLHPQWLSKAIRRWFAENSPWKLYHPSEPAEVASVLQSHGVERFVFCSYAHKPGIARDINSWLVETSKELRGVGLPLLTVHPDDKTYLEDAKEAIAAGCIGLKIHEDVQSLFIDDSRFDSVFAEVEKIQGFVLAHVGPIPWRDVPEAGITRVKRVKKQHPNLKLVVAHMGAPDTMEYFELLDQTPNLYLDTTMCFSDIDGLKQSLPPKALENSATRILFGSDYPNIPYPYEVEPEKLKSTGISQGAIERIMRKNAIELLKPFT